MKDELQLTIIGCWMIPKHGIEISFKIDYNSDFKDEYHSLELCFNELRMCQVAYHCWSWAHLSSHKPDYFPHTWDVFKWRNFLRVIEEDCIYEHVSDY